MTTGTADALPCDFSSDPQLVLARIIEPASKIDSFEPTQAGNVGSAACAS